MVVKKLCNLSISQWPVPNYVLYNTMACKVTKNAMEKNWTEAEHTYSVETILEGYIICTVEVWPWHIVFMCISRSSSSYGAFFFFNFIFSHICSTSFLTCAATVWDLVGNSFVTHAVLKPASDKPNAARRPAPPAPTTTASNSWSTTGYCVEI